MSVDWLQSQLEEVKLSSSLEDGLVTETKTRKIWQPLQKKKVPIFHETTSHTENIVISYGI